MYRFDLFIYFIVGQHSNSIEFQENNVVTSQTNTKVASPFRPPPAPPLPPSPFKSVRCLIVKLKPKTEWERDNSFLEELSKRPPKLRHVELSPGGRPVRRKRSPAPTNGLSFVLKKRYMALHNSPRMSMDQCMSSPVTSLLWKLLHHLCTCKAYWKQSCIYAIWFNRFCFALFNY